MTGKHVEYSEAYVLRCRAIWYEKGSPSPRVAIDLNIFPPDELGRVVEHGTVRHWITDKGWYEWKDVQDAQLATRIDDELLAHKMLVVKEQLAESREVRKRAFEHIIENGFDSSAAASSSFFKASQEERTLIGVESIIEKLSKMQPSDLRARMKELADRADATIIDVAEVQEDAESSDT